MNISHDFVALIIIFGASYGFNIAVIIFQILVQKWEYKRGFIPERHSAVKASTPSKSTSPFLYYQDFTTHTWGDGLAVPVLLADVIYLAHTNSFIGNVWGWMMVGIATMYLAMRFYKREWMAMDHKPDWAYPAPGVQSWGGWIHLHYMGFYVGLIPIVVVHIWVMPTWLIISNLIAILGYLWTLILDRPRTRKITQLP